MPTVSVFFRKDDLDKWKAIENKSEWLHTHLQFEGYLDTVDVDTQTVEFPVVTKVPDDAPLVPRPLSEMPDEPVEKVYVYLDDLVFVPNQGVFDKETMEKVGATAQEIKELKKRGQVQNG